MTTPDTFMNNRITLQYIQAFYNNKGKTIVRHECFKVLKSLKRYLRKENVPVENYIVVEKFNEIQLEELHSLFKNEWWTQKRSLPEISKLIDNSSVVLGLINSKTGELIGFARVISDTLYRAFIFDVIAKEDYRNSGIGTMLMNRILEHPQVKDVERVELYCPDRLIPYYEKFGFSTDVNGSKLMRISNHIIR